MLFCRLLFFSKSFIFEKFFQEYHLSVRDPIQIRPDVLSGLIWVQNVCKGYQQTTSGGKELTQRVCSTAVQLGCFHCMNMCKLTPKEVAAELLSL